MAGNKKSVRKSAGTRSTLQFKGAAMPILDLPPDPDTLKQLADMALADLNAIVDGTGKMKNWMGVIFRLHVGIYAATHYFVHDDALQDSLYRGIVALRTVQIRSQLTGELGLLVWEFEAVTGALGVTEIMMRSLRLSETQQAHYATDDHFKELIAENKKSYPDSVEALIKTLHQERAEYHAHEKLVEEAIAANELQVEEAA